jgi:hypothetical protein
VGDELDARLREYYLLQASLRRVGGGPSPRFRSVVKLALAAAPGLCGIHKHSRRNLCLGFEQTTSVQMSYRRL